MSPRLHSWEQAESFLERAERLNDDVPDYDGSTPLPPDPNTCVVCLDELPSGSDGLVCSARCRRQL